MALLITITFLTSCGTFMSPYKDVELSSINKAITARVLFVESPKKVDERNEGPGIIGILIVGAYMESTIKRYSSFDLEKVFVHYINKQNNINTAPISLEASKDPSKRQFTTMHPYQRSKKAFLEVTDYKLPDSKALGSRYALVIDIHKLVVFSNGETPHMGYATIIDLQEKNKVVWAKAIQASEPPPFLGIGAKRPLERTKNLVEKIVKEIYQSFNKKKDTLKLANNDI